MVKNKIVPIVASAALAAVVVASTAGCSLGFYQQDVGEVVVTRGMGGEITGSTQEAGFHGISPFSDAITYSTRNNVISFIGGNEEVYEGGSATGSQVNCNDAGGATFEVDIQVNYSLDPNYAEELYANYGTQENYVQYVAAVDVRSVTREVAGKFSTITLLTDRGSFTQAIEDALADKWSDSGITIEQVSVQEIRYPVSITDKYAEAQAAEIEKAKAQNKQETAKVEAETKVIQAQGEADANKVLAESLSDEVLTQHYIDALESIGANGNLVVVPEGSMAMIDTDKGGR